MSYKEVENVESENGTKPVDKKLLEQEFMLADMDHDGFLSPSEIEEVLWEQYYASPQAFQVKDEK